MFTLQTRYLVLLVFVFVALPFSFAFGGGGAPFQACRALFPGEVIPNGPTHNTLELCKTAKDAKNAPIFAALHNTKTKVAVWTAHRLTPEQLNVIRESPAYPERTDFFDEDPDVPKNEQAQIKNYRNSGFNRGHLVRALDLNWSKNAYETSYVMTNMAPQTSHLNSGAWLGLEKQFQNWVAEKGIGLWAFAGSWGQNADPASLQSQPGNAIVPACFFKIVVAQDAEKNYKVLSAVFPNNLPNQKQKVWVNYLSTLDIVEKRSGLDFLRGLSLEPEFDAEFWGVEAPSKPSDCS
ncbi:DNA/RNA non-specific endonuclease [Magnetovibrio sp. PR-2]|uniref:DNA/RNA non-specific endonuclease n=1 Tax=Magnetovibrio sp. PR-2 TaxID=3120356 RepID=UPI002FCE4282